jgi:hypothetical protein
VLATAVDLVLDQRTANDDLERLAFLIVLFRQVTLSVSNPAVVSLAETVIGPLLLPRGPFSATILAALANPIKPHPLRASEALSAAARMCASVTSNESLLAPLLAEVLRDGLAARPNLVAVNAIVEHVPADQVPADLLPRLLADLSVAENANVRSAAVATLLGRRRESPADTERARDEVMFAPLIPLLGRDDDGATVQNVRRYLLDPLFTTRRASFPTLLEMLSSRGDEYFAAWITVASFGVSTGLIGIDGLNMDRLQDAIVHQDHKIRVLAFELVAINKSVLESEVMELVKESLRWNQDVTHPG